MYLKRLYLMNYRNIAQADLQFSPKLNWLVGRNGMGKTNVLDSIHYLSFCKSSLNPSDSQILRHDADCMMLDGTYQFENEETTQISCSFRNGRKQFRRDHKDYRKFSDHIGLVPLVMICPDDISLISGSSEERRRFMDLVISQYDREYLNHLINYNKALAQRNALLKLETMPDDEIFDMYESVMDSCASVIFDRRREFVDNLIPRFRELYSRIGVSSESVGIGYISHLERVPLSVQLRDNRQKEHIVGYSLHGIHKDDIEMTLDGYPIRREGSQGQNKSYLTALKLAQYQYLTDACHGRKPILLLDDLFDKLDPSRVERILAIVSDNSFGQIFITDADREHVDTVMKNSDSDCMVFNINNGEVE